MSYITLADLGRRGGGGGRGGGGRHWGGGGRRWGGGGWYGGYGGAYPYYDVPAYPAPIMVMDPVDPQSEASIKKAKEEAEKAKIQAIAAAVRAELAKSEPAKGLGEPWLGGPERGTWNGKGWNGLTRCTWSGMGQSANFIDMMGPGARDDEIDSVAKDGQYFDEAIPAQQALLYRQQAGLVDQVAVRVPEGAPGMSDVTQSPAQSGGGCSFWAGASILAGAALGYVVGAKLIGRKAS